MVHALACADGLWRASVAGVLGLSHRVVLFKHLRTRNHVAPVSTWQRQLRACAKAAEHTHRASVELRCNHLFHLNLGLVGFLQLLVARLDLIVQVGERPLDAALCAV